jgi:hypothetical protein
MLSGEKGGAEDQTLGRSRSGRSTNIYMAVRGLGYIQALLDGAVLSHIRRS